ncbi:MBL fold metallo-hydrolase [Glaciihabitans sp. GrIS 2.15]|jgi:L-ascorbate metabolism protein UlaG (beta-lactamase superfamily)|uniref:MBL fold metallo-hydrolase n=1 Tax=Glaciihabitans sp. GrIS 2.15 TaxID=3071710 RepID=UPI00199AAA66|nr:MBL fold metallo-hydrolase [Microbacteriaceae bacterium]MEC5167612.1 L-ascorbate metabolism protein UlaG (beta-lactamase superfamily) [Glaciihabitans sp. GrIS 2.15]
MRITKQEHACLILESSGKTLVIDPGIFTTALVGLTDVVAVVITHEHGDHWTADQLTRILKRNPDAKLYGPEGVALAATDFDIIIVKDGDTINAEPFSLRFFGEKHAVIHSSIPIVDNVGVLVNDALYYPGDSFTVPEGVEVDVLAAPVGAPWLKIGEAIDFVLAVRPRRAFATHEMVLSTAGKAMGGDRLKWAAEQGGGEYVALEPGDTLDL